MLRPSTQRERPPLERTSEQTHTMLRFHIDDDHLLVCRASGTLEFLQVAQTLQTMMENPQVIATGRLLIVIADEDACRSLPHFHVLRPLLQRWSDQHRRDLCALVLPDETYRVLAEAALRQAQFTASVRTFVAEPEAYAWLKHSPQLGTSRPATALADS